MTDPIYLPPPWHHHERYHYWHFMAAYFMPAVLRMHPEQRYWVEDCGPMHFAWEELAASYKIEKLPEHIDRTQLTAMQLKRYGNPQLGQQGYELTSTQVDRFRGRLFEAVRPSVQEQNGVLLITRKPAPDFYKHLEKGNTSGAGRRYLQDPEAIAEAISQHRPCRIASTEGLSIKEQVELFGGYKYIVMQHGAAMFNLIFSIRRGVRVVEITHPKATSYFAKWCRVLGVTRTVLTGPDFGQNINPQEVANCIP